MAALLASAILAGGSIAELYEGGELWIIEKGGKHQEIKLSAEAGFDLLKFLLGQMGTLEMAAQRSLHELEEVYGIAAHHSEHRRGEPIIYRDAEGEVRRGVILWVAAAGNVAGIDLPLRYIVDPERDLGMPDVVWPSDVQQERPEEE